MSEQKDIPDFSKPFIFFRKPGTTQVYHWKSHRRAEQQTVGRALGEPAESWIVAPFLYFRDKRLWHCVRDEETVFEGNRIIGLSIPSYAAGLQPAPSYADTPYDDYTKWVNDASREIMEARFAKTALSKIRKKKLREDFDWVEWFNTACLTFPNAFIFFVHIPDAYTWAGATPELFLSSDAEGVRSVSLAGTLHPDSGSAWSDKEMQEQLFVTDYIKDAFVRSGFRDVAVEGPQTISIGKLSHLKTSFRAGSRNDAQRLGQLIDALHPTPAVGGLPQKNGLDFILKSEKHPREWYSGFLGTVSQSGFDLYVNLRCMMVCRGEAVLYAGAGITAQSDAESEWKETENKLRMNMDLLK